MPYMHQQLLSDGSLVLSVDESLRDAASPWMPTLPRERAVFHAPNASIRIDKRSLDRPELSAAPVLALGDVNAWLDSSSDVVWLENATSTLKSRVDLPKRFAAIGVASSNGKTSVDMTSMLTIVAALLLIRDGRTPVHAGAVVDPSTGVAWLLVGDSHSGKSTTTANLIRAGWLYLSDDYIVMVGDGDGVLAEGWPDDFHLDEGWARGEPTGRRGTVVEHDLPGARRAALATVGGMLFPRVEPDLPTTVVATTPAIALERLIRQSPWLVADKKSAAKVFELLTRCASKPCADIRLGLDTFAQPELLARIVREFTSAKPALV